MNKLLTLLICLLALISCKENKSSLVLSDEDNAIATLQLYQNVSPELIEERNKLYQLMLKHSTPPEEPSEEDKAYFLNNIAHIDSVVNRGVALIKEQKGEELLTLLEAEIINFYAHPHNTVESEYELHKLLIKLNRKYCASRKEFLAKTIQLLEYNLLHIGCLEESPTCYTLVLQDLTCAYLEAEENSKAVVVGEMLCESMPEDNVVGKIIANLLLSKAYDRIGEKELRDSCVRSVMHYPEFIAVYVEVDETIGLPEELKQLQ